MERSRIEDLVATFPRRCRDKGLHLTPQRAAIYEALASSPTHPSAERIHELLAAKLPSLSLATVYKTLETFREVGLIELLNVVHETARYDAETTEHHHLICERCKTVEDVYDPALDALNARGARKHGFSIRRRSVHFYGLCADCSRTERPAPGTPKPTTPRRS
ncbi:MAG: Fur family transcriptional regulator [Acidobacteriota bacterium]